MSASPVIGFSTPTLAAAAVQAMVQGVAWVAESRGAKVLVADGQLEGSRQLEQIKRLVDLRVDALLVYPVASSTALRPLLDLAAEADIPLFSHDDVGHPAVITKLLTPGGEMARLSATLLHHFLGGEGSVVIVDGIPAPQIQERTDAFRRTFAEEYPRILLMAEVVNGTDDAAGARAVVADLLQRHGVPDGIVTYNDASAIGAADAVEAAGATVTVVGCNGEPESLDAIRAGRIAATVERHPIELAQRGAQVILDVVSGALARDAAPPTLTAEPEPITAVNVDNFLPWPNRAPEPNWSRTCRFLD